MKELAAKFKYQNGLNVIGLTKELDAFYVANYFLENKKSVLLVTSSLYEANKLYESILNYTDDVLLFPMDDFFTSVALAISPELKIKRLETLEKLKRVKNLLLLLT